MGLSIGHLLVILLIVLVLFGAGKLPNVMSDLGKGLRAFKDGMKDGEEQTKLPNKENASLKKKK